MRAPLRILGAGTPDALPSGEYVVPIIGSHIATDKRRIERPLGRDIAYPRLHPNGEYFACQIHDGPQKDHVFEYVGIDAEGKDRWIDHGYWPSVSPCIYKHDGTLIINGRDGQWGSQGLRYVNADNVVISADDTYGSAVYGLSEFTPLSSGLIALGQTHDNNRDDAAAYVGRITVKDAQGRETTVPDLRLIESGPCRYLRVREAALVSIAIWKPQADPTKNEAVFYWLTRAEMRSLPVVSPSPSTPHPAPTPEPKPEPIPMPDSQIDLVKRIRAKYPRSNPGGHPLDRDSDAWRCIVEIAQATGTLVYRKDWGENCRIPAGLLPQYPGGVSINRTIIGRGRFGNQWVKVLGDGEGTAFPIWNVGDTPADGEYVDVSSINLGGAPQPKPEPEPEPEPQPVPGDLEARVARIEAWIRRSL